VINRKFVLFLFTVFLALSINVISPAQASVNMQAGFDSVIIGTISSSPTIVGFGNKQWIAIGYDGKGIQSEPNTITLFDIKGSFGKSKFKDSGFPFWWHDTASLNYEDGELHTAMTDIYHDIKTNNPAEGNLILPTDLDDTKHGSGNITLRDQYVWPLSATEASGLNFAVLVLGVDWWLRSTGLMVFSAHFVFDHGIPPIDIGFSLVDVPLIVRPAFKLDISSLFLVSDAAGNKPKNIVNRRLSAVEKAPVSPVKLTVVNHYDSRTNTDGLRISEITFDESTNNTSELLFGYAGVTTGPNRQISCVLTGDDGRIAYYGQLVDCSVNNSGTLGVPLTGVADGIYLLKIFNEQVNPGNFTDFVSKPIEIPLKVLNETGTVAVPLHPLTNNTVPVLPAREGMNFFKSSNLAANRSSLNWA
jgi:hypothetical protein